MYARSENGLLRQYAQGASAALPPCTGEALGAAFFLDFMYWQRPAKQVEASPWYEAAAALARRLLAERARQAPPVTPFFCGF